MPKISRSHPRVQETKPHESSAPPRQTRAAPPPPAQAKATDNFVYVSASTVTPTDTRHEEAFHFAPHVFLRFAGLGNKGPLGKYGPLGTSGPAGTWAWNPARYISGAFCWDGLQQELTASGGPLSADGPLGANGPLGEMMDATASNPFQPGGMYAAVGPWGPLGALGALGPLGPVGAHGFRADADGNYVSQDGSIQRTIRTEWTLGTAREWGLLEDYTEKRAKELPDNDTSFMVEGAIANAELSDTYRFRSNVDQYVTVLVLPELASATFFPHLRYRDNQPVAPTDPLGMNIAQDFWRKALKAYDDFDVEVLNADGKVVARSNLLGGADWIHLKVPAGTDLQARVKLRSSVQWGEKPYRLFVVGSNTAADPLPAGEPWEVTDKQTGPAK